MAELANRNEFEKTFARRMSRLNSRHRKQLTALIGNPPDASRVPESFWQRVQKETEEEAAALLFLIFLASASQHGLPHAPPGEREDLRAQLEADAKKYAADRVKSLVPDYVANSKATLGKAAADWETRHAAGDVVPKSEVLDKTTEIFGPSRAEGLGVTETTGAASAGGDAGIGATVGLSDDDEWWTSGLTNVCPTCKPFHRTKRRKWGRFFPAGPPAHVRCNCFVKYAAATGKPMATTP